MTLLRHLGTALITSICDYQAQEVRMRMVGEQEPPLSPREKESQRAIQCVIIEPGESLEAYKGEFSLPFRDSFEALQKRLHKGCALLIARGKSLDGADAVIVGYSIIERGGFSSVGITGKLPDDVMFTHYTEVAVKFRGRRIAQIMSRAKYRYYHRQGITRGLTTRRAGPAAEGRALGRLGGRSICRVVQLSLLRGLVVWRTPWKRVETAIAGQGQKDLTAHLDVECAATLRRSF